MIVYRGQTMFADQINKFKQNVGGFLSFNNFLSTSLEKDVPQNFLIESEEIEILFEMQIDPTIEKFPMIKTTVFYHFTAVFGPFMLTWNMISVSIISNMNIRRWLEMVLLFFHTFIIVRSIIISSVNMFDQILFESFIKMHRHCVVLCFISRRPTYMNEYLNRSLNDASLCIQ